MSPENGQELGPVLRYVTVASIAFYLAFGWYWLSVVPETLGDQRYVLAGLASLIPTFIFYLVIKAVIFRFRPSLRTAAIEHNTLDVLHRFQHSRLPDGALYVSSPNPTQGPGARIAGKILSIVIIALLTVVLVVDVAKVVADPPAVAVSVVGLSLVWIWFTTRFSGARNKAVQDVTQVLQPGTSIAIYDQQFRIEPGNEVVPFTSALHLTTVRVPGRNMRGMGVMAGPPELILQVAVEGAAIRSFYCKDQLLEISSRPSVDSLPDLLVGLGFSVTAKDSRSGRTEYTWPARNTSEDLAV